MKSQRSRRLVIFATVAPMAVWLHAQKTGPSQDNIVEWLTPAAPSNHPQTSQDAEKGSQMGCSEHKLELLEPTCDLELPTYRPRKDIKLSGTFKAACSDVLPRLVKLWVEGFRKYYPNVNISSPPPYAGSLGAKELVKGNLDFVFVSRELKPDDITDFKAKFGYQPLSVPICGGALSRFVLLVHVGVLCNKKNKH